MGGGAGTRARPDVGGEARRSRRVKFSPCGRGPARASTSREGRRGGSSGDLGAPLQRRRPKRFPQSVCRDSGPPTRPLPSRAAPALIRCAPQARAPGERLSSPESARRRLPSRAAPQRLPVRKRPAAPRRPTISRGFPGCRGVGSRRGTRLFLPPPAPRPPRPGSGRAPGTCAPSRPAAREPWTCGVGRQAGKLGLKRRMRGALGYPKARGGVENSASLQGVPAHPAPAKCLALNPVFKKRIACASFRRGVV